MLAQARCDTVDLVLVDDEPAAAGRAAVARLGHLRREAIIVSDLLARRDVAQGGPPGEDRLLDREPARVHDAVGIAGVIDPAALTGEVPEHRRTFLAVCPRLVARQ